MGVVCFPSFGGSEDISRKERERERVKVRSGEAAKEII